MLQVSNSTPMVEAGNGPLFMAVSGAHQHLPAATASACCGSWLFEALPGVPRLGEGLTGARGLLQRERLVKKRFETETRPKIISSV